MIKKEFLYLIKQSNSKTDLARKLGFKYLNGKVCAAIRDLCNKFELDESIIKFRYIPHNLKYERIEKVCPVCNLAFTTVVGRKDEKTTCSVGCSNTYFRSGPNNGNWKQDAYRSTCFEYHKKKCIICDEDNIVAVHHYDYDRNNNDPKNLIPLCPTHHQYLHSSYSSLIIDKVRNYIENFSKGNIC